MPAASVAAESSHAFVDHDANVTKENQLNDAGFAPGR